MKPASRSAFKLFHEGVVAFANIENTGMPVNSERLEQSDAKVTEMIRELETELRQDEVYNLQRKLYGKDCSLGSLDQLATVLYKELGYPGAKLSEKSKKFVLDDEALEALEKDHKVTYLKRFRRLRKLQKLKGTYLDGIRREMVNGRIHGFFNLHLVQSYRGSADTPNLNNLPSRDKEVSKFVKSCITPEAGFNIVEVDFGSLEVRIGACYHKDPTLLGYLETGYDMHSDIAKQCYRYDDAWIAENPDLAATLRTATKGDAVFSWTYGNYYIDVSNRLWKTATRNNLLPYLRSTGITHLGIEKDPTTEKWIEHHAKDAFVTHIKGIEEDFWGRRFRVYDQWRRDWYDAYRRHGYFETLTGFMWHGVEKRNFILNCPIQGSAFHCLLQSIIDLQKALKYYKMRSRIICEIHDSIIAEVPDDEMYAFAELSEEIMCHRLRQKWPWIITDLPIKIECSPISWHDKTEYHKE